MIPLRDEDIVRIGRKLNNRDYLLLKYLYYYRCLSVRQCWDLCYRDVGVDEHTFIKKRIKPFLTYNLISLKKTAKAYVLSITDIGIEILSNRISLNNDFFDPKTKTVRTGVLKESKIQISPRLMDHQIFLNQFVVDFSRRFKREEISKNSVYRYFD